MKKMFATVFLILVISGTGYSGTCDNQKCEEITTSMRMVANLQSKFHNYRIEKETEKTRQEELIQNLRSELTTLEDESKARKIEIIALLEKIAKLNESEGPAGPQGEKGEQGNQGEQGTQGDTGETGIPGDPGAIGPEGDIGANGTDGDRGPTGPTGDSGPWPKSCTDADPCISSPCKNIGLCEVTTEGYKCRCPPWKTGTMCENAQFPSCQYMAECDASVASWIFDLHEETPDTVLVTGQLQIVRCNVAGGSVQIIPKPAGTQTVYSTILMDSGEMWTIAHYSADGKDYVYRMNTNSVWHQEDQFTYAQRFDINKNGTLLISDNKSYLIHSVKTTPEISVEATLDLSKAVTWGSLGDFAVLPSGAVVGVDIGSNINCAHIVGNDGGHVATLGTCGSSGAAPSQFNGPAGVCADMSANILISDSKNNRISVFSSTGDYITTLCQGELQYPTSVLVTSSGYMLVGNPTGLVKIFKYYN